MAGALPWLLPTSQLSCPPPPSIPSPSTTLSLITEPSLQPGTPSTPTWERGCATHPRPSPRLTSQSTQRSGHSLPFQAPIWGPRSSCDSSGVSRKGRARPGKRRQGSPALERGDSHQQALATKLPAKGPTRASPRRAAWLLSSAPAEPAALPPGCSAPPPPPPPPRPPPPIPPGPRTVPPQPGAASTRAAPSPAAPVRLSVRLPIQPPRPPPRERPAAGAGRRLPAAGSAPPTEKARGAGGRARYSPPQRTSRRRGSRGGLPHGQSNPGAGGSAGGAQLAGGQT